MEQLPTGGSAGLGLWFRKTDERSGFLQVQGRAEDALACEWARAGTSTFQGTSAQAAHRNGVWEIGPLELDSDVDFRISLNSVQHVRNMKTIPDSRPKPSAEAQYAAEESPSALCDVCKKPTWDGQPGYCSEPCEQAAKAKAQAGSVSSDTKELEVSVLEEAYCEAPSLPHLEVTAKAEDGSREVTVPEPPKQQTDANRKPEMELNEKVQHLEQKLKESEACRRSLQMEANKVPQLERAVKTSLSGAVVITTRIAKQEDDAKKLQQQLEAAERELKQETNLKKHLELQLTEQQQQFQAKEQELKLEMDSKKQLELKLKEQEQQFEVMARGSQHDLETDDSRQFESQLMEQRQQFETKEQELKKQLEEAMNQIKASEEANQEARKEAARVPALAALLQERQCEVARLPELERQLQAQTLKALRRKSTIDQLQSELEAKEVQLKEQAQNQQIHAQEAHPQDDRLQGSRWRKCIRKWRNANQDDDRMQ